MGLWVVRIGLLIALGAAGAPLCLAQTSAQGGAASALPKIDSEILAQCFDFEPWLTADYDTIAQRVAAAIRKAPDDPATMALVYLNQEAVDNSSKPDAIGDAVMDAVRAGGGDIGAVLGANSRALLDYAYEVALRNARWEVARSIEAVTVGIREWMVVGPFAARAEGDMVNDTLPPDLLVALGQPMQGAFGVVEWKPWTPDTSIAQEVSLADVSRDAGSGWFMLTEVNNPGGEREVVLDVGAGSGGFKVWLNGAQVMYRLPSRDQSRDDAVVVRLPAGKSTLLIKLGLETIVTARVCEPMTRLIDKSLTYSKPSPATFVPFSPAGNARPLQARVPPTFSRIESLHRLEGKDSGIRPLLSAVLALVSADSRSLELAEDYWKDCEAWRVAAPVRDASLAALYYEHRTVLSPTAERQELRRKLQYLIDASPGYVKPRIEMAKLLSSESLENEAAKRLMEAAEARPHWTMHVEAAEFFDGLGWEAEARDSFAKAFVDAAQSPFLLREAAEFAQRDLDDDKAAGLLDVMLATWPGSNSAVWRRFTLSLRRGEFELAERMVGIEAQRAAGESRAVMRMRLNLANARGDTTGAIAILRALAAAGRRDAPDNLAEAAMLAFQTGDRAVALPFVRVALEARPGDERLRRAMMLLEGLGEPGLPTVCTPVSHALIDWIKAEDYPKAAAGILLDEEIWTVNSDGSFVLHGQKVTKILRIEAVDQYGRGQVPGEVLRARTLLPGGGEAEPASVTGSSFEYPRVAPGVAIDTAWTFAVRGEDGGALAGRVFRFRERDLTVPTAMSRLVVVAPSQMALRHTTIAFEHVSYASEALSDGTVRHVWELRRPESREPEPSMPSMDEIIPSIQFLATRSTNNVASSARSAISALAEPRATWLVREKVAEIHGMEDVDAPRAVPNGGTAPSGTSEWDGDGVTVHGWFARKAYRWVNANIKSGFTAGSHPHSTLQESAGDREELYLSLLEAAGVPYRLLRVGGNPVLQSFRASEAPPLHRRLVAIPVPEAYRPGNYGAQRDWLLLDLGNRLADFGELGTGLAGAQGIEINPETLEWSPIAITGGDYRRHGRALSATIVLSGGAEPSAEVVGKLSVMGDSAWQPREDARTASQVRQRQSLENALSRNFQGITLGEFTSEGVEEPRVPFSLSFTARKEGAMQPDGRGWRMAIPFDKLSDSIGFAVSRSTRQFDLVLSATFDRTEEFQINAPPGFGWSTAPAALEVASGSLTYSLRCVADGDVLRVSRSVSISPRRIPVAEYQPFKRIIDEINAAESTLLVLTPLGR